MTSTRHRRSCRPVAVAFAAGMLVALATLASPHPARSAEKPVTYEYVVLIDTSKSMIGEGAGNPRVIFPRVKQAVSRFIDSLDLGRSVVLVYTFDSGLKTRPGVPLRSEGDKAKAVGVISRLNARGQTTAIYTSLGRTLDELKRLRKRSPDKTHVQTVLLFTDGRDNQSGVGLGGIISKFRLAKGENPYLFLKYVTLGTAADPAWRDVDGVDVVSNAPGSLPELQSVRVRPVELDFGSLVDSDTAERVIEISYDEGLEGSMLKLSIASASAEKRGALLSIEPSKVELKASSTESGAGVMRQAVTLRVDNRESLERDADYSGRIDLSVPEAKLVALSPAALALIFTTAAEPEASIQIEGGLANGTLGTLDPYDDNSSATTTSTIGAMFNNTAVSEGSFVSVRLVSKDKTDAETAFLLDSGGQRTNTIRLTPDAAECDLEVAAEPGQPAGQYVYELQFEGGGTALSGVPVDPDTGLGVVPVRFTVAAEPPPPTPTSVVVMRWAGIIAVAALVLAVVAFVAMCLITGSGPTVVAGLLVRRLSPKLKDARIEVTAPADLAQQFELTGRKSFEVGPNELPLMPYSLRFEPRVSVLSATDEATVCACPKDAATFFTITRASTGADEPTSDSCIATGDAIRVDGADGSRFEFVFRSFSYVNV